MELDSNQIEAILPHRYPFLLIDRVTECIPGQMAKGVKAVSANEMQFMGHFPGKHVMPGVLLLEALAQTGAVALLTEEENKGKIVLFGGVKSAKFKRQVVPGDLVELHCEIITRKGPIGVGKAVAKVGDELAVTAELMFAIEQES
ncbi:MAG: 3-hydroxyacyl-ACP dehydratase FabZ [Butyrivibrio sp.]